MSSLIQLYNQYEQSIVIQSQVIESYKEKLKKARLQKNPAEIERLQKLLKILTEEKHELQSASIEMRRYLS